MPFEPRRRYLPVLALAAAACAGGKAAPGSDTATEAEWRALGEPRPEPLEGAPRIAVGDVELVGSVPWPEVGVRPQLGISELVVTGLLSRRDVDFVERRRFAAAVETERRGARPTGQPPAGVSPGADYLVHAVWIELDGTGGTVDVRLVHPTSGEVASSARRPLPPDADAVGVARGIVAGTLDALDRIEARPAGDRPPAGANDPPSSGVSFEALEYFLHGLAAEERWRWEEARRGYQAARRASDFPEASAALARTARLRLGGTIAES